jgi:hypothetical protein
MCRLVTSAAAEQPAKDPLRTTLTKLQQPALLSTHSTISSIIAPKCNSPPINRVLWESHFYSITRAALCVMSSLAGARGERLCAVESKTAALQVRGRLTHTFCHILCDRIPNKVTAGKYREICGNGKSTRAERKAALINSKPSIHHQYFILLPSRKKLIKGLSPKSKIHVARKAKTRRNARDVAFAPDPKWVKWHSLECVWKLA